MSNDARTDDLEPDAALKRNILEQKLRQYQARAYEETINAQVARSVGGTKEATKHDAQAKVLYDAARETRRLLDALPSDDGDEG